MTGLGIPEDKIHVIPNGVDREKFYPLRKHEAREKLCLSFNERIVLSVGWLTPRKGFDLLIRSIKILDEQYGQGNLRIVIVGAGESRSELEKLILIKGWEHDDKESCSRNYMKKQS